MVYLNHGATTYPKPQTVLDSVMHTMSMPPQSQYRSAAGLEYRDVTRECRENLSKLFHIPAPERIFLTSGSTQALNMAILGLQRTRRRIVITATEHNAVLRTIIDGLHHELQDGSLEVVTVPCDESGYVDMAQMKEAITEETSLVVTNHCSNVTGALQDVEQIGQWAQQSGACFLVDASQSAGAVPIDVISMHIDLLAFTAHKGLYGIQGSGGLYIREGLSLRPILFGGTGADSRTMIPEFPFYEVGTANLPGISGLNAGVKYVLDTGIETIQKKEQELMGILYEGLVNCQGVKVYASRQPEGTALSFNISGLPPADVGYILSGSYDIVVRTGLHCAPFIHEYLGAGKEGTVRVSISSFTKKTEVEYFLHAIKELTSGMSGVT